MCCRDLYRLDFEKHGRVFDCGMEGAGFKFHRGLVFAFYLSGCICGAADEHVGVSLHCTLGSVFHLE